MTNRSKRVSKLERQRINNRRKIVEESMSEDGLRRLRNLYLPAGSGPLGAMAMVCALVEMLAEEHGWNLAEEPE